MKDKEIEKLIARNLTGEATANEQSEFRLWLNASNQNQEEFGKIALTYQLSKSKSQANKKSEVFSKIKERIDKEEYKAVNINHGRKYLKNWVSIAATVIIFLSVGTFYFLNNSVIEKVKEPSYELVVKSNPSGQKSKVFLPDGSIVWLNSETSISYEKEFNDSARHVNLIGEAFFEVKKDQERPFVVFSGSISTTALGTAFNINAFDENNITVALTKGKVNVKTTDLTEGNKELIINAGEGVFYSSENEDKIGKITIDPTQVKLWRDGYLHLNNASLSKTLIDLERWYGVKIILKNEPVNSWNANGLFDNEYLDNVLTALSFSQEFKYEIDGKYVYITFK